MQKPDCLLRLEELEHELNKKVTPEIYVEFTEYGFLSLSQVLFIK